MAPLETITSNPPNLAADLTGLAVPALDQDQVYVRCNFDLPEVEPDHIVIAMPGHPERRVSIDEILTLPRVSLQMVLECAGNGRTLMDPVPDGTPWTLGGVSPILAEGPLLRDILGNLPHDVVDVVFTGADAGDVEPEGRINYQFAIDRETALSGTPIIATHLGGEPLTMEHGAPARLVVPGHYAMKSVKWLTRIEATKEPFSGHFVEKYRYYQSDEHPERAPVGPIAVRSVVTWPADGETVEGPLLVTGTAWSANGVESVEVSIDGGATWQRAELEPAPSQFAARTWRLAAEIGSGRYEIVSRARSTSGELQPIEPRWNANGYANNVVHRVRVDVL